MEKIAIAEIKEQIQQAISKNDVEQLRECFYLLKNVLRSSDKFARKDLIFYIDLLKNKTFLKLGGGWYFALVFDPERDVLPFHQFEEIADAIPIAYDALEEFLPEFMSEAIEAAIHLGQEMRIKDCAAAILSALSRFDYFPKRYFNLILGLLKKDYFLKSHSSYHFLFILEAGNWEIISEQQKNELLPLLESSYGLFADWMSCFVITELLGQGYANEAALNILCRLKKTEADTPRALVPHGLQHFVTDFDDLKLAEKAYEELLQMKEDPSEKVCNGVNESLRIIANRGKIPD